MAHLVVLYLMSLPSLEHLVLHRPTYEKPHWTKNVLYVVLSYFRYEQRKSGVNLIKSA